MGKIPKEEYAVVKKQKSDLLKLILHKTGATHKKLVELAEQDFIVANLDVITPSERKQFDKLVF